MNVDINKINLTNKISEKYFISNNTFIHNVKKDKKDRLQVEIGDIKQEDFYPQVKIKRWDNEVNFSVRLIDDELENPSIITKDNYIVWKKSKKEIKFYDLPVSEIYPEGGYEFEITLKEKPIKNTVEFTLQTKEIEVFYQPPLNEEILEEEQYATETDIYNNNGNIISHRDENVVGSYAVYYKNSPKNVVGGKEYRAGKAFHIYRPRIEDAVGNWVWGNLSVDINNNKLIVTIPQEFLNNAVYPVTHAAGLTFGYTTKGATTAEISNGYVRASKILLSEQGELSSLAWYIKNVNVGGTPYVKHALYSDASGTPNTLLSTSNLINVLNIDGWVELTATVLLNLGNYWIVNNQSTGRRNLYWDTGLSQQSLYKTISYTSYPSNPFGTVGGYFDYVFSAYATYTANTSSPPTIIIQSFDKSKISAIATQDICTVTFQSDQNLTEWEARADGTGQGSGYLVGNGTTVTANTDVIFTVENEELTLGDKIYKINIYGKNESGVWSAYE